MLSYFFNGKIKRFLRNLVYPFHIPNDRIVLSSLRLFICAVFVLQWIEKRKEKSPMAFQRASSKKKIFSRSLECRVDFGVFLIFYKQEDLETLVHRELNMVLTIDSWVRTLSLWNVSALALNKSKKTVLNSDSFLILFIRLNFNSLKYNIWCWFFSIFLRYHKFEKGLNFYSLSNT